MVAGLLEENRLASVLLEKMLGSALLEKILGPCVELEKMSGTAVGSGPGPRDWVLDIGSVMAIGCLTFYGAGFE